MSPENMLSIYIIYPYPASRFRVSLILVFYINKSLVMTTYINDDISDAEVQGSEGEEHCFKPIMNNL